MEGTEIKAMRKVLGLSRERLAARLGVSFMSVYNWECGRHKPSYLAIYRLELLKSQLPKKTTEISSPS